MTFGSEILELSEGVFAILRDLIRDRTGMHYEAEKRALLADKLTSRAVELGFSSFLDYYYLLKYGPGSEQEWPRVLDALSVPETYFWREMDQIHALVGTLVPNFVAQHPHQPITIWCAACASGEEPLTIAMALQEAGWFDRVPIRIQASDASMEVLVRARAGLFRSRSFRTLPPHLQARYFTEEAGGWRIDPRIHARVEWAHVNLMVEEQIAPFVSSTFVFCRNVFIYFSPNTIAKTVQRFSTGMRRPGYLFTGAAESLVRSSQEFELREVAGAFVYVLE
jgi:chemotaxis protein methyltransferase CheR